MAAPGGQAPPSCGICSPGPGLYQVVLEESLGETGPALSRPPPRRRDPSGAPRCQPLGQTPWRRVCPTRPLASRLNTHTPAKRRQRRPSEKHERSMVSGAVAAERRVLGQHCHQAPQDSPPLLSTSNSSLKEADLPGEGQREVRGVKRQKLSVNETNDSSALMQRKFTPLRCLNSCRNSDKSQRQET